MREYKTNQDLPICPKCNLPFKARIKRSFAEKLLSFKKDSKKYGCGQCGSKFLIVEEKS